MPGLNKLPVVSSIVSTSVAPPEYVSVNSTPACEESSPSSPPFSGEVMSLLADLRPVANVIKHIPRSARAHCASELTEVISTVLREPESTDAWSTFLNYSSTVLSAPRRSGRRHNLASLIRKRSAFTAPSTQDDSQPEAACKRLSDGAALAAAVMSKIEDGNIKAAVRILCSDDCPAPDSKQTVDALRERHPAAAVNRTPIPDPSSFSATTVCEADIVAAIRSFPAGSAGGPDKLRPQHLRDLTSGVDTGPALITAITGLVNLIMDGKCPSRIAPILFGGTLIALNKNQVAYAPLLLVTPFAVWWQNVL